MKTKFYAFMMAAIVAIAFNFIACNNEKDDPKGPVITPSADPSGSTVDPSGTTLDPSGVNTVAQMIAQKAPDKGTGTEKYWVEAYIIGYYNFNADPKFIVGAENAQDAQILIADDPEITQDKIADYDGQKNNVMAIKLEAGIFRTKLNLKDNPGNYKKKVRLHGIFEMYCGVKGLVSLDEAVLDGETIKPTEVDPSVLPQSTDKTIAEVNAAADDETVFYTISGQITEIKNAEYGNFMLKDESGSIYVYGLTSKYIGMGNNSGIKNDKSFPTLNLVVGDIIKITGTKTTFSGSPEFANAFFVEKLGHDDNIEPDPSVEPQPIDESKIISNYAIEAGSFIEKDGSTSLTNGVVTFADGVAKIDGSTSASNMRLHTLPQTLAAGSYILSAWVKAESDEAKARIGYTTPDPADNTKTKYNYDKGATTLAAGADYVEIQMEFTLEAETDVTMFVANNGKTGKAILVNKLVLANK